MFKFENCELLFCSSGDEALRVAAESPVDVVFSDVRMPEMDGPELLSRIAELYPQTIRYAWTGQTELSQQDRLNELAHQVFTKPCNTETLCEIIQTAMELVDRRQN